jgi:hypothetical protein
MANHQVGIVRLSRKGLAKIEELGLLGFFVVKHQSKFLLD